MANTVDWKKNGAVDTTRGPSPAIWADCPIKDIIENPGIGVFFRDDFTSFPITPPTTEGNWGQYAMFSSTGGTATAGTGQGGELVIGSDGDNEGVSLRTVSTPFKITRGLKKLWFECRIKFSDIADTKNGLFVGLRENAALDATHPIAAAGTLADENFVGFHRLEGDGDQIDTVYKANGVTQVTVQADALASALVADTYVKLGLIFEPENDLAGTNRIVFFNNNLRMTTSYNLASGAGTDFPNDVGLGLVLAMLNATASSPGTNVIDWWQAAQLL